MSVLIPIYTPAELEVLSPVVRQLPDDSRVIMVGDPQYRVLERWSGTANSRVVATPIGCTPYDAREFLRDNDVSLVITAHDAYWINVLFLLAAKKLGIASVYVPHGALSAARGKTAALKLILAHAKAGIFTYGARYVASGCLWEAAKIWLQKFFTDRSISRLWDVACVAGPASKALFLKSGIPEDAIVVTGQPRYDSMISSGTRHNKASLLERFGLDTNAPVVVVATQPFVEDGLWTAGQRAHFFEHVVAAVHDAGGQLLIKLHPRETSAAVYRSILSRLGSTSVPIVNGEVDLATLLTACDAVLTVRSTIGLEAMILGVPIIAFESEGLSSQTDELDYVKYGAAVGVYGADELAAAIASVLYDTETRIRLAEASRCYVYDHSYLQDGRAGARVAHVIASRLEGQARNKSERIDRSSDAQLR